MTAPADPNSAIFTFAFPLASGVDARARRVETFGESGSGDLIGVIESSPMNQALPDKPALIAVLLVERPMCLDCISQKVGASTIETDRYLTAIGTALELRRTDDRCQTCGQKRAVYSLIRSSNRSR
jgi:hypothetical protein